MFTQIQIQKFLKMVEYNLFHTMVDLYEAEKHIQKIIKLSHYTS